jgi:hypothetical protein
VVVNETRETWKVAMITKKGKKAQNVVYGTSKVLSKLWTMVMVPKRGTALEVDLPWFDASVLNNKDVKVSQQKKKHITIQLES